jgi:hypothetical protein
MEGRERNCKNVVAISKKVAEILQVELRKIKATAIINTMTKQMN